MYETNKRYQIFISTQESWEGIRQKPNSFKELRHAGEIYKSSEKSYKWLKDQGFNFYYHTHIEPVEDGKLAIMCYEEGYVLEADGVKLFPSSSS